MSEDWGLRLKSLREKLGKSQRQFAEEINVTNASISMWESNKRKVPGSIQKLIQIYEKRLEAKTNESIKALEKGNFQHLLLGGKYLLNKGFDWTQLHLMSLVKSKTQIEKARIELNRDLNLRTFKKLSELRGLSMKFGQLFGFMSHDFPEDLRAYLESYQYNIKAMDSEVIEQQIHKALGKHPNEIFKEWHRIPFAGGSIGQVHYAKTHDDKEIALKVQYPDIANLLKRDLDNLDSLSRFLEKFFWFGGSKEMIQEMRERFMEETDYSKEVKNLKAFNKAWNNHPTMRFPKVYEEYCSEFTIATEYIEGEDFYSFSKRASDAEKEIAGRCLFQFYFESIYQHQIYNCDPHPGNYIFKNGYIYFLDFGCVKYFNSQTTKLLRKIWLAAIAEDFNSCKNIFIQLGLVANEDKMDFNFQYNAIKHLLEPIISAQPYRINHHYVRGIYRSQISENPNLPYTKINPDFVFMQRLQFGLYSILADLDIKTNWNEMYMHAIREP